MVNRVLYESKLIGYPKPFKNKVRTFCQNPGGFVSQENYDNDLAVVNGHSYKEKKSENTNLAILVSHNFTEPFNQPIAYAQKVGELTNMLANGQILVQRFGDILDGKRTWQKELAQSNIRPTLPDAVAGDITAAMPYRAMTNIIEFIKMLDMVVPGFAANETLLYSPELKFYSNKVKDGLEPRHQHQGPALPRRLFRLDPGPDDGVRSWACSWAGSWPKKKKAADRTFCIPPCPPARGFFHACFRRFFLQHGVFPVLFRFSLRK